MKIFGRKVIEWSRLHDIPAADRKNKVLEAINHFVKKLMDSPVPMVSAEKMQGADANLQGAVPVMLVMSDTVKQPDRGYELIFREVDMRQSSSPTFDILDVSGGVTFYQQKPGQEAKLSKLPAGAKTSVGFLRFTGGFPILDDWLRFNQYYKIDQLTADTVRRWFDKRAELFYGLLTALGSGINEAFDTDDATTINNACVQILTDLDAAGYVVDEGSEFVIACNPVLKFRILKALAASFLNPNSNTNQVVWNIGAVITTTKLPSTSYYVCLPGEKAQRGEWEDLNTREPQRNELVLGADHVWTGAYNGAIAETRQFRRCALS